MTRHDTGLQFGINFFFKPDTHCAVCVFNASFTFQLNHLRVSVSFGIGFTNVGKQTVPTDCHAIGLTGHVSSFHLRSQHLYKKLYPFDYVIYKQFNCRAMTTKFQFDSMWSVAKEFVTMFQLTWTILRILTRCVGPHKLVQEVSPSA